MVAAGIALTLCGSDVVHADESVAQRRTKDGDD